MIELYKSPWRSRFEDAIRSVQTEITIVAPFIKVAEAERICEIVKKSLSEQSSRLRVVTSLRSDSVLSGALDIEALKVFQGFTTDSELINLPRLHAKVYIVDKSLAIVGSANLTSAALDTNYEYSVGIKDPTVVSQIYADMLSYAKLGSLLSKEQIEELSNVAEELILEYRGVQKSVTAPSQKEIQRNSKTGKL